MLQMNVFLRNDENGNLLVSRKTIDDVLASSLLVLKSQWFDMKSIKFVKHSILEICRDIIK